MPLFQSPYRLAPKITAAAWCALAIFLLYRLLELLFGARPGIILLTALAGTSAGDRQTSDRPGLAR